MNSGREKNSGVCAFLCASVCVGVRSEPRLRCQTEVTSDQTQVKLTRCVSKPEL